MNKIDMSIGSLSLKTEGTQFLANHVWSMYNSKMRVLHEMIRVFLADYHNHRFVNIGYTCKAASGPVSELEETFVVSIGQAREKVVVIKLFSTNKTAEQDVPHIHPIDQEGIISGYDHLSKFCKDRIYDKGSSDITAQTLLHPFRALVNNVLTAAGDARMSSYIESVVTDMHQFIEVRQKDNLMNYITFDFYSPYTEVSFSNAAA